MTYSEAGIQRILCRWALDRGHDLVVPNVSIYAWESDLLSVTRAGMVYDYEIKISRADFRREAKKRRSTLLFDQRPEGESPWSEEQIEMCRRLGRPNYFYYVAPAGLLTLDDLPARAGLVEVDHYTATVAHRALRLHAEVIGEQKTRQLARSLMYRYWRLRGSITEALPELDKEIEF